MERKHLLYMVSSDARVSPFDVNMAYDAGFDAVIPYPGVTAADVGGLTQDIMFSRGPKGARYSALFISSSDLRQAEAMLQAARSALFDPFRIGVMVDPKGGYTTAAALLARADGLLRARGMGGLTGRSVLIVAGTGGVGRTAAAMAAADGARVVLTSRRQENADRAAGDLRDLFRVQVEPCAAAEEGAVLSLAQAADLILATGPPGVQLLSAAGVAALRGPKVLADVNAVPPAGIGGLKPQDEGTEMAPGLFALGPLAIGGLKIKVEASLLEDLLTADRPPIIDSAAARRRAGEILAAR
jgi:methylene-tetrahydromethanopterin dehydrogenase